MSAASPEDPAAVTGRLAAPTGSVGVRIGFVWLGLVLIWLAVALLRATLLEDLPGDVIRIVESVLAGALGVALVILACRWLDRRTLSSLGLGSFRRQWRALLGGAVLWTTLAAVAFVVGAAAGSLHVELAAPTWLFVGWLLLQAGLVFCYEALPEELAMRGYAYTNLAEKAPRWLAVVGQAMLFMLWVLTVVGVPQALGFDIGWSINLDRVILLSSFGLTLALVRLWSGSLWASIGFHWAYQTFAQLLSIGRLTVLRVPEEQRMTAHILLWFFTIVLGGTIALVGIVWKDRRHRPAERPEDGV